MSHQVFISYAKSDYKNDRNEVLEGSIVAELKQMLTRAKIDYWIDEEGLSSGVEFAEIIAHAIVNSDALIFVSTEASNRSQWTARELALAQQYDKPILPL
ncbi:MAG: toll/interleukin-1 receptor domain-containing protein, partial [Paludibacteraceae bacterium]|nr:toll/interleukin-1 receptor domain-containing protein [Paludibacteraceae bacterium]